MTRTLHRTLILAFGALASFAGPALAQKAAIVRETNNPAFQPVQLVADLNYNGGFNVVVNAKNLDGSAFIVPAGKRLVVEYLSSEAGTSAGNTPTFASIQGPNGEWLVRLPYVYGGTGTLGDQYTAGGMVRAYVDAGKHVAVGCSRTNASGNNACFASVVGYLVDLP